MAFARFCDAIEDNSVAIFAAEIAEKFSSIDVLINAAGRGYVRALAMMRMTRAFMPLLRRASGQRMLFDIAPGGRVRLERRHVPLLRTRSARSSGSPDAITEQAEGHVDRSRHRHRPSCMRWTAGERLPDRTNCTSFAGSTSSTPRTHRGDAVQPARGMDCAEAARRPKERVVIWLT